MVGEPDIGNAVDRQSEANDSDKHHDIFQKQAAVLRRRSDTRFPLGGNPAILIVDRYRSDSGIVRAGVASVWRKIDHFSRCVSEASHLLAIISVRGHGGSGTKRAKCDRMLVCRPRTEWLLVSRGAMLRGQVLRSFCTGRR